MKRKTTFYLILAALCILFHTQLQAQHLPGSPGYKESLSSDQSKNPAITPQPIDFYQTIENFEEYYSKRDKNAKGSGYKPFKRWQNLWKHSVKADGTLPSSKELFNLFEQTKQNTAKTNNSNWTSVGPINTGVNLISLPGQGRVNEVVVDPNNSNIIYAGAPAGGIWKSLDAGQNWTPLFDDFPQIGVSGIAIDPNNSDIIYIATGDGDNATTFSIGVYKSIDGGNTWNPTGLNASNVVDNSVMHDVIIHPQDSNILWASSTGGLYKSIDAGDTWERIFQDPTRDFELKPDDPNTIYLVTPSTYHKSVDGGATFTRIRDILPNGSGRLVLGVTAANPDKLFILSTNSAADDYTYQGLFVSEDAGETFTQTANEVDIMERNQADFNLALDVDPNDENTLYVGCVNVWKSENGGQSFTRLNNNDNDNGPAYTHVDIHVIRHFGNRLFVGSDGGLFVSEDAGANFSNITGGLVISQFYRFDAVDNDINSITGGTQDNSGFILNNGQWDIWSRADGMDYEFDRTNPNLVYGFSQFGSTLFVSTDKGQENLGFVGAPRDSNNEAIQGEWITPLEVDEEGNVYSGFDALYKLNGGSWEKVSGSIGSGALTDVEVAKSNSDIIYVSQGNTLYRSSTKGQIFIPIQSFQGEITSIFIDEDDANQVYVTTSFYLVTINSIIGTSPNFNLQDTIDDKGLFRIVYSEETNSAQTEDLTLNLSKDLGYFTSVKQPQDPLNTIFLGTSLGVFMINDEMTEWELYGNNMPTTPISDMEINLQEEVLIASTYGRGIWVSPITITEPEIEIALSSVTPANGTMVCDQVVPTVTVENRGIQPINSFTIQYQYNDDAMQEIQLTQELLPGATAEIALNEYTNPNQGFLNISATVSASGDEFASNNSITSEVLFNRSAPANVLYDFETAESSLFAFSTLDNDPVWEVGQPQGGILNTASSGFNVIGTNLDGNHPDAVTATILSPCYDFTGIVDPILSFQMAFVLEANFDILYVEYTTDTGQNWQVLGSTESLPNWYNSNRTPQTTGQDCQNCVGAQWNGAGTDIVEYSYNFNQNAALGETDLTAENQIAFRIVFVADPATNTEGVIIDDFSVTGIDDDDDDDNDGVLDVDDNCPVTSNADQTDTDLDGFGDACDTDDDNDLILDSVDNCSLIANPNQEDFDLDGIGDLCDPDRDGDGVPNEQDLCPNTPLGSTVDLDGCPIFALSSDNFSILTSGLSCIGTNNGSVQIDAVDTSLNYTAALRDENAVLVDQVNFSSSTTFTNLGIGTYTLCFTVEGQVDYELCSNLIITEPEALGVSSKIDNVTGLLKLSLEGGDRYFIKINNDTYITDSNEFETRLSQDVNTLEVSTDKSCQGIFKENIILNSSLLFYPNPLEDSMLHIIPGSEFGSNNDYTVRVYNSQGQNVLVKPMTAVAGEIQMNLVQLADGLYIIEINNSKTRKVFKLVKK